jgi:thiamine biosynthesis protein ThiS
MQSISGRISVKELIESLGLLPEATAVQRNDAIVPRSAYGDTILTEGDVIELVRFVGGG